MKYDYIQESLNEKLYNIMDLFHTIHYKIENSVLFPEYWLENEKDILDMVKHWKKDLNILKENIKIIKYCLDNLEKALDDLEQCFTY